MLKKPEKADEKHEKAERTRIVKARLCTLKIRYFQCIKVGLGFLLIYRFPTFQWLVTNQKVGKSKQVIMILLSLSNFVVKFKKSPQKNQRSLTGSAGSSVRTIGVFDQSLFTCDGDPESFLYIQNNSVASLQESMRCRV